MVKFLNSPSSQADAEDIMNNINDYILFNNKDKVSLSSTNYNAVESLNALREHLFAVNHSYQISTYNDIKSEKRHIGKLIVFVKKVIRKLIRWYVGEITNLQTEHNACVTRVLNENNYLMQYLYEQNMELKETISELEYKITNNAKIDDQDQFYLDFENTFRGDFNVIKERLKFYLPHFAGRENVIDIGCGRGEFLQLMKENNITAIGVDTNSKMVESCKKIGLNAVLDDGISYLEKIENESLDGIFSSQVVEHLSFQQLINFINVSYKKLKKGGCLIIETINPLTLGVFSYSFYIDPTHVKPVHPASLRFILERYGFDVKPIQFLDHFTDQYKLTLQDDMEDIQKQNIQKINEAIFGAQDYAIICERK